MQFTWKGLRDPPCLIPILQLSPPLFFPGELWREKREMDCKQSYISKSNALHCICVDQGTLKPPISRMLDFHSVNKNLEQTIIEATTNNRLRSMFYLIPFNKSVFLFFKSFNCLFKSFLQEFVTLQYIQIHLFGWWCEVTARLQTWSSIRMTWFSGVIS